MNFKKGDRIRLLNTTGYVEDEWVGMTATVTRDSIDDHPHIRLDDKFNRPDGLTGREFTWINGAELLTEDSDFDAISVIKFLGEALKSGRVSQDELNQVILVLVKAIP